MSSSSPKGRLPSLRVQALQLRRRDLTPHSALWLLENIYTPLFGPLIRFETPRSIRLKIQELEEQLHATPRPSVGFQIMARNILLYERVAELLEKLPRY